jgi:phospholipid transport system substrate-binding protein
MGRALAAWLLVGSALAAPSATPREVVESAVTRVVSELHDANLNARATEPTHRLPARRRAEITRVAADLFDYEEVARLTLPRYWAVRTPEERAEFVRLFTQLLQRTYIRKLESYSEERIVYLGDTVDGSHATVRSKVISGRRRSETPVDYQLHLKDGHWCVYDVRIDGVSFVSTYRTEFSRVMQRSSYESLVALLRQRVSESPAADTSRGTSASPRAAR